MSDNGHETAAQRFIAGATSEHRRVQLAPQRTTAQLSSAERCAQTDALLERVQRLTAQVNRLTTNAVAVDASLQAHEDAIAAVSARGNDFTGRSFWHRLLWLVTGR